MYQLKKIWLNVSLTLTGKKYMPHTASELKEIFESVKMKADRGFNLNLWYKIVVNSTYSITLY